MSRSPVTTSGAQMARMSAVEAESLYNLLDENVGMFRFPGMSEAAVKFCDSKRKEFIQTYSTSIPKVFWFQGGECSSAELVYESETGSFHVTSEVDCTHTRRLVENLNKALYRKHFRHS